MNFHHKGGEEIATNANKIKQRWQAGGKPRVKKRKKNLRER